MNTEAESFVEGIRRLREELAGFAREAFGAGLLALFRDTPPLPIDK